MPRDWRRLNDGSLAGSGRGPLDTRKSLSVLASAAGLSSRHRAMRGKRTAIPDL